jgi:diguanylate cyclase (GGDEF)-like protein
VLRRQNHISAAELATATEADRLRIALSASGDLVYDWSPSSGRIQWSGEPAPLFGVAGAELFHHASLYHAMLDEDGARARRLLIDAPPSDREPFCLEYRLKRTNEEPVWLEDRGACFIGPDGRTERVIGSVRDVTPRKAHEAKLAHAAHYDEMTGHLTRGRLKDRLAQMLAAPAQCPVAFCVVAIDELAVINEVYGVDAADDAIVAVGKHLTVAAGEGAVIGRTAGNKFGIVLPNCGVADVDLRAARLRTTVRDSVIETAAGSISVTVSAGAVVAPDDADTAQRAMARAEEALDRAKGQGRGGYAVYVHSHQRESNRRRTVSIGDQILSALADDRVVIAYQPIVEARTGKLDGYECLARILRSDGTLLPAGDFIPVAEQLGLVRLIDRRILDMSLAALRKYPAASLALNVSGMTASDHLALDAFAQTLEQNRDIAPRLVVELTETAALLDIEESVRFTARLRDIGARVAIDDFGAGYTSFRNLQALRVDMVKIDGSFVRGIANSPDNHVFVRTLVDLARNFRLQTVAEWVGDQREADILCAMGVDFLQGFHFGKPELRPEGLLPAG